ncbi:LysM peptidoglycan-binding domain-containing protein [Robertkochia flava]|uniref:LysM peptidoglycan-binding domain-containing protein n=1 Tax=Robertkochia flava TaxID=3447986 RepID=UPI001CCB0BD6|nr:LysM peptidoglycan-binding domain-containing protein [Robertkochia marina]
MKKNILVILALVFISISYAQQQFKTHAVKEGETIEQIARKYQVTPYNILKYNPEAKKGLEPNTVLVIPVRTGERPDVVVSGNQASGEIQEREVERFIKHRVKRKETLYSLAQKYNITEADIKRYNKELYGRMPRKGERLEIPVFKPMETAEGWKVPEDGMIPYIVRPAEGKWRIAYEHGITQEELERMNPEMKSILQEGDTLMVPFVPGNEKEVVVDSLYNYYVVKPAEGFYRLKVKLGLSKEELEALNPALKESGLQKGMILKLPKNSGSDLVLNNGMLIEKFALKDSIRVPVTNKVGLILPFDLKTVNFDSLSGTKQDIQTSPLLGISLDFYTGAMVALDSVRDMGISVDLTVYDSGDKDNFVLQLMNQKELFQMDAIVGPVRPSVINDLSKYLETAGVPVFAPFANKGLEMRSNVYQTLPPDILMRAEMMRYLENHGQDKNVIIIADADNAAAKARLKTIFPGAKIVDPLQDKFLRLEDLNPFLSAEKENWVILESGSFNLIGNVTAVVNSAQTEEYKITLLTTLRGNVYDNKNISNLHLSNLKFHYPTFYKPLTAPSVFHKQYERRFGVPPNRYATRGFDLMFDVLLRLAYNKDLEFVANKVGETQYVENKFNYQRGKQGGYINSALYIVQYENLTIKEVIPDADLYSKVSGSTPD